jgi:hypothetical protein
MELRSSYAGESLGMIRKGKIADGAKGRRRSHPEAVL